VKRALSATLLVLLVLVSAAFATFRWADHYLHSPLRLQTPIVFVVASGSSFSAVARELARKDVLEHPRVVSAYVRLRGQASRIHAGEYEIRPDTTPAQLIDRLIRGQVLLHELTIVEGWTVRDMLRALESNPYLKHTLEGIPGADLMARIGAPSPHPEGRFFPDTYRFARGTSDVEVLRLANEAMRANLEAAWKARSSSLPFSDSYQALILASLVEKESALPSERQRIAGVFVRRLRLGMRLQSDPTVIYGLGESYAGDIRSRDLQADTPYNTYTRKGLPPTPIALPGKGSLQAATQPQDTGALFFVATGEPDGSHYFSATLAEHDAAVKRYLARIRSRARAP
jgi:peptidoglycan lytic transglycosylase G